MMQQNLYCMKCHYFIQSTYKENITLFADLWIRIRYRDDVLRRSDLVFTVAPRFFYSILSFIRTIYICDSQLIRMSGSREEIPDLSRRWEQVRRSSRGYRN